MMPCFGQRDRALRVRLLVLQVRLRLRQGGLGRASPAPPR